MSVAQPPPPTVEIRFAVDPMMWENVMGKPGVAKIGVTTSDHPQTSVSVYYKTVPDTATAPADYAHVEGQLIFGPGVTGLQFEVPIVMDAITEPDEKVKLILFDASAGGVIMNSPTYLTIKDGSVPMPPMPASIVFEQSSWTVSESVGTATITAKMTGSPTSPVTVNYATSNGTAIAGQDYTATNGVLTWQPSEAGTTKSFTVAITNDMIMEPTETINLTLSNPSSNAVLGSPATAVLNITDDDEMPKPCSQFTVTGFAGSPSSYPVALKVQSTASLTAMVNEAPTGPGMTGPVWGWKVSATQYSSDGTNWGSSPGGETVTLGTSTETDATSVNTLTGSFGTAGYWKVTVTATATYTCSGGPSTASASMDVIFPVYVLTIAPPSVWVPLNGSSPAMSTVTPAEFASWVTYSVADESIASVTVGSPSGGNTQLTVMGVKPGTTQLQALLGSGPAVTANVTVGTFSLHAEKSAICAGGVSTPIHQTLLTATLTNSSGAPLPGQQVTFSTSDGKVAPASAVTDSNGLTTTTLTSSSTASNPNSPSVTHLATVTAVVSGQSAEAKVEFQPPQVTLTVLPSSILPTETANCTFEVKWGENPVSGHNANFYISGIWDLEGNVIYDGQGSPPSDYGSIQSGASQTDGTGTATAQFVPGTKYCQVEVTAGDKSVLFANNGQEPQAKDKKPMVSPIIVETIGFGAGKVTLTNVNPPFAKPAEDIKAPEWNRKNKVQSPAAFVRNHVINMTVDFTGPANKTYKLRALTGTYSNLSKKPPGFAGTNEVNVAFADSGKGEGAFSTSAALGDWVDWHTVGWKWQYFDPVGMKWTDLGQQSTTDIYAVDQTPLATSDGKNYVHVVEFGCLWGAGLATGKADEVFSAIWWATKALDKTGYKYWGKVAWKDEFPLKENTTRGLICNRDGRCEAWTEYFSDACKVQGIAVNKFYINPPFGYLGLVVNKVELGKAYGKPPAPNATDVYLLKETQWPAGIAAQGTGTPGPPAQKGVQPRADGGWLGKTFLNHYLTYRDTNGNGTKEAGATPEKIYDPSYGLGGYDKLIDWKTPAIGAFGTVTGWLAKPVPGVLEILPQPKVFNTP